MRGREAQFAPHNTSTVEHHSGKSEIGEAAKPEGLAGLPFDAGSVCEPAMTVGPFDFVVG